MKRIFTRLTILTLIAAFVIPMLNTVVVWPLYITVNSDIAYADWVSDVMYTVYSALDILLIYAMAVCLAYAFVKKGERLKISLIVALSLIVVCAVAVWVDVYYNGSQILTSKFIGYNAIRVSLDAMRLLCAALVSVWFAVWRGGENSCAVCRISTGVILLSEFIMNLIETLSIFRETAKEYENWAPQNIAESLTIITPYIYMMIYFILGYFLCRGLLFALEGKKVKNEGA